MSDRTDLLGNDWGEFPTVSRDQWLQEALERYAA